MKKIIIVNNNMKVGGVQKSLYNLLWSIDTVNQYDVTLLLFSKTGPYADELPDNVKVIECGGPFRYLGKNQGEFKNNFKDTVVRGFFASISRVFGRKVALRLMLLGQPTLSGNYDHAVAYLHNGRKEAFYGGVQEYVLKCIKAKNKIAFLHCDYQNCGANHSDNNRTIKKFDKIAACSDGCRRVFESLFPDLKDKCVTVQNCHRFAEIKAMSEQNPIVYDDAFVNVVIVARLTREKGIERAIKAVAVAIAKGDQVKLHVVGSGAMYEELRRMVHDIYIEDQVIFYGEQKNPYRYMKNADLFLLTSYHEAAPMVVDEARILGLPILTTETTSSQDMVIDIECGWVCGNSQEALNESFCNVVADRDALITFKRDMLKRIADNSKAIAQLGVLLND